MKKLMITLAAALPLLGGAAVAEAAGSGWSPDTTPTTTTASSGSQATVVGTIVSVDATNGTFVANAFVVPPYGGGTSGTGGTSGPPNNGGGFGFQPGGFGGFGHGGTGGGTGTTPTTPTTGTSTTPWSGWRADDVSTTSTTTTTGPTSTPTEPTPTQVTITTNSSTTITLGHSTAPLSQLAAGDRFRALFTGSPTDSIGTLVASPALSVNAAAAPKRSELYAFVGTVKSTDTTAGTVTVDVTASIPSGLVASGTDATFTVGSSTLVIGGSSSSSSGTGFGLGFSTGSLSSVSTGDIVAGGLIGSAGETATQVEADPLMLLLDFPTSSTSSTTSSSSVRAATLKRAEALLGKTASKTKKTHKHAKKKH